MIILEKLCTKCLTSKAHTLFHKCNSSKDGLRSWCKLCRCEYSNQYRLANYAQVTNAAKRWKANNPGKRKQLAKNWRINNPEKAKQSIKDWRSNNPEKVKLIVKRYKDKNPDKAKAYRAVNKYRIAAAVKVYNAANLDKCRARTSKRRAFKLQATLAWADQDAIKDIYTIASILQRMTGRQHHVDHVIPLNSEYVCGLHVHNNLRVTLASVNLKKSNRYCSVSGPEA